MNNNKINSIELEEKFTEEYRRFKGKAIDICSKNIIMSEMERNIVNDFCEENNISYANLMKCLLYRDGAFTDELLAARRKIYPNSKLDLSDKYFTYNYKEKYTEYVDKNRKTKNFNVKKIEFDVIEDYEREKGFTAFARYGRYLLNSINIYPEGFYQKIMERTKETYDRRNKKRKSKLVDEDKRKYKKVKEDDELSYETVIVTVNKTEKREIIKPFSKFVEDHGLNVQHLFKYKLYKLGIVSKKEVNFDDDLIEKIIKLKDDNKYRINSNIKDMRIMITDDRKNRRYTSAAAITPKNPEIRKIFSKYIPVLFKIALYEFGAYGSKECLELFAHPNKLKIVEDVIKSLKK